MCPFIGKACIAERCLAFEQVHETDRRTQWDNVQPPLEIRCKALDRTFVQYDKDEWDAALNARVAKQGA